MPDARWQHLESLVTRCGGGLISLPAETSCRGYDSPSDPRRAALLTPPLALVAERRSRAYIDWVATNGYMLVSLPLRMQTHSFALLPPRAAAYLTQGCGEPDRSWDQVEAERRAGRGTFPWILFAAWELGDINGWAFGPDLRVWSVEDSVPFKAIGSFDEWLDEMISRIEDEAPAAAEAAAAAAIASADFEEGEVDDDELRPESLDDL